MAVILFFDNYVCDRILQPEIFGLFDQRCPFVCRLFPHMVLKIVHSCSVAHWVMVVLWVLYVVFLWRKVESQANFINFVNTSLPHMGFQIARMLHGPNEKTLI